MNKGDDTVWVKVDEGVWINALYEMCQPQGKGDQRLIDKFLNHSGDSDNQID